MNGTLEPKTIDSQKRYAEAMRIGSSNLGANKFDEAVICFQLAVKESVSKKEFLLAHLFLCKSNFRKKPFSIPLVHYIEKINIAYGCGDNEVEQVRLRLVCEVLRYSNNLNWCLEAHDRLWHNYGKFFDGIQYLNLLINKALKPDKIEHVLARLSELLAGEQVGNKRQFFLAAYRYYVKVNRINLALQHLSNYADLLETVPSWVCKETKRMQLQLEGKADYYLRLLRGDRALLEKFELLDRETANGEEAMGDIGTSIVFSEQPNAIEKLHFYMHQLPVSEQLHILKFALAHLPRDVFENIEIPQLFSFVDLALLQQKSKSDFLSWLDACKGTPEPIHMELFKVIRAVPNYLGGKDVVAFYGNSSFFKYKTSKVLVIGFCGLYGDMFMPISSYAYFFETRPDLSQLWLNDVSASNFARGISGFGRNVLEMSVKLKSLIDEYQFEKVVCIGNSAGGSAAAFFARHLGADEAIGLSAPTFVDLENIERNPSALYEGFIAKGIDLSIDLRNFYKDAKSPKLTLFYGDQNPVDVQYATHMEGLPNVTLRPLEGEYSHSVLPNLILSGEFQKVIHAM